MKQVFAPGCALVLYKPELGEKLLNYLNKGGEKEENQKKSVDLHLTCCQHQPNFTEKTEVINICAGCDKRYSSIYNDVSTVSMWEVLSKRDDFKFPDYKGKEMTIHDPCPVRGKDVVYDSVRNLLEKMNIKVIETKNTREKSVCCGDSLYGKVSDEIVEKAMKRRADEMPCEDVVVYCVSCIKSIYRGGKKPRHLVDLLFGEQTEPQEYDTNKWHEELQCFIDKH